MYITDQIMWDMDYIFCLSRDLSYIYGVCLALSRKSWQFCPNFLLAKNSPEMYTKSLHIRRCYTSTFDMHQYLISSVLPSMLTLKSPVSCFVLLYFNFSYPSAGVVVALAISFFYHVLVFSFLLESVCLPTTMLALKSPLFLLYINFCWQSPASARGRILKCLADSLPICIMCWH